MTFTGLAGQILGLLVSITAYASVLLGLGCIVIFVFDLGFTYFTKGTQAIIHICQYVAYRKEFHKWRKSHLDEEGELKEDAV